jgi:hypothetical protein
MAFLFKLETTDGVPAEPPTLSTAVPNWKRLAAGVSLFALSRRMGTSVEMIDRTYGHLTPDAEEYKRVLLDAFDARENEAFGHLLDTGRDG